MEEVKIYRNTVKLNDINIFYRDTMTEGTTILCLHGRMGRGETWVDFMKYYGKKYRIIAPDQRGHGLSSKPVSKYTAEEMAADMVAFIKKLGINSVIVVGHSMGGRIAGFMAVLYPEFIKALVILDKSANGKEKPNPLPLDEIPQIDPFTRNLPLPFTSFNNAKSYIRKVVDSELGYNYFMESLIETTKGYELMYSTQAISANIEYEYSWFHLLPQIKCPVAMIRATGHNVAVPKKDFDKMKSLIADCVCFEMSNPNHNVHLSDTKEFYGYLDSFLKKI